MKNVSNTVSDIGRLISSLRVRIDSKFLNLLERHATYDVEKTRKMCRTRILIEGAFLSPFGFETIVNS